MKEKSQFITVRVDNKTRRSLEAYADQEDRSISSVVRIAIQDYLWNKAQSRDLSERGKEQ